MKLGSWYENLLLAIVVITFWFMTLTSVFAQDETVGGGGDGAGNGGFVVNIHDKVLNADRFFQPYPTLGTYTFSPEVKQMIETIRELLLRYGFRDDRINQFFTDSVLSRHNDYKWVDKLPHKCIDQFDSGDLENHQISCTKGQVTFIIRDKFLELDFIEAITHIIHERLHHWAPTEPHDVISPFMKGLIRLIEIYNDQTAGIQYYLSNEDLEILNEMRRRGGQLTFLDDPDCVIHRYGGGLKGCSLQTIRTASNIKGSPDNYKWSADNYWFAQIGNKKPENLNDASIHEAAFLSVGTVVSAYNLIINKDTALYGTVVFPGSVIQSKSKIKDSVLLNATVDSDSILDSAVIAGVPLPAGSLIRNSIINVSNWDGVKRQVEIEGPLTLTNSNIYASGNKLKLKAATVINSGIFSSDITIENSTIENSSIFKSCDGIVIYTTTGTHDDPPINFRAIYNSEQGSEPSQIKNPLIRIVNATISGYKLDEDEWDEPYDVVIQNGKVTGATQPETK